jgi:hypothetical protein
VANRPASLSRAHSISACRRQHVLDRLAAARAHQVVRVLAVRQGCEFEALARLDQRQSQIDRAVRRPPAGFVAVKAENRLVRHPPQQSELVRGERGAERRHGRFVSGRGHGDDVDIALHRDQALTAMRGRPRGGDVVERRALVEERRLRRVEVLRRNFLIERAAAEGDDAAAPVGDRKYHPVAKAVIGNRDVLGGDQKPRLDHVLDGDFRGAEMLLERILLGGRIAEPELELRRGRNAAVGEIAAAARAISRRKRRFEKLGGKLDDVVERLSPLLMCGRFPRHHRHRHAGLPGQPLDRLGEAHALGEHDEVENVAVLARGEVKPHRLLVVDEEGRRLLLVERRQPLKLAPGFAQFHAPADDFRDRKPRPQLVEKLRRESHGDSAG